MVRNLNVTAENDSRVKANAIAVGGGLLVGVSGAFASANVAPTVTAGIAANSDVTVTEDIFIDARAIDSADVDATGVSIAGGAAGGAAVAFASLVPVMLVSIGSNTRVRGRSLRQRALHNISADGVRLDLGADANAAAGAGSLVASAAGAVANANVAPTIDAVVSPASVVTLTGNFQLLSLANNDANANATGVGIGLLKAGVGAANADAIVAGVNRSRIDSATVTSTTGNVEITTDWFHNADATVVAAGGGIQGAFSANRANADVSSDVDSFIQGSSTVIDAGDDVIVSARTTGSVDAATTGVAASAGVSVGASIATAQLRPGVDAYISGGSIRAADDLTIQALSNASSDGTFFPAEVHAKSNPSGGGLIGINGADIDAIASAVVNAAVSPGVTLRSTGGDVVLAARAKNVALAEAILQADNNLIRDLTAEDLELLLS